MRSGPCRPTAPPRRRITRPMMGSMRSGEGLTRQHFPFGRAAWGSRLHKLFRGRVHCAGNPGLPGLYRGGNAGPVPERSAQKSVRGTHLSDHASKTARAERKRCGLDRPVTKHQKSSWHALRRRGAGRSCPRRTGGGKLFLNNVLRKKNNQIICQRSFDTT